MTETMCFTIAIICFIASFVMHVLSVAGGHHKIRKSARVITFIGAVAATGALVLRWRESGHPPLSNMFESLATLATMTVWAALFFSSGKEEAERKPQLGFFDGAANIFAVLTFGIASLFPGEIKPLIPALQSYWLHLHVAFAFIGEACFAISFILSYLLIFRNLMSERRGSATGVIESIAAKSISFLIVYGIPVTFLTFLILVFVKRIQTGAELTKSLLILSLGIIPMLAICTILFLSLYLLRGVLGDYIERFAPSEERMDELIYRSIAVGFPLFTVGALIFGMVWANKAWGRYWGWDPKETWALITFLVYSTYLHLRLTRGWNGNWMAIISVVGFLVTIFTLFGVNLLLSGLHSYAG
ncbi:MAG: c-type cytochrome biogenesis protein CcsB [Candidatus Riflebacteria bacterium]|nr:c-type cytochrome biogenesis protein CcsB [Candidatus Riflebacteria bacterium]